MHALIQTVAFRGIDTTPINVQVHIANVLPAIAVVGLANKAVAEPRESVARFIVDLRAEATISRATIAEALAYRAMPLLA